MTGGLSRGGQGLVVASALADPCLWEAGCQTDPVRNELVVPDLVDAITRLEPRSVIDVGSGTGFVARRVAALAPSPLEWILVDKSIELLQFADERMDDETRRTTRALDLTVTHRAPIERADLAFAAFTLLEFAMSPVVAKNFAELLRPGGTLLIYLPDPWEDVLAADGGELQWELASGSVALRKVSPFTGQSYPFVASRLEVVIEALLRAGFALVRLDPRRRPDVHAKTVYVLEFVRGTAAV